jgi:hypothetical protein
VRLAAVGHVAVAAGVRNPATDLVTFFVTMRSFVVFLGKLANFGIGENLYAANETELPQISLGSSY